MSILTASILFTLGFLIIVLVAIPGPHKVLMAPVSEKGSLRDRFQRSLNAAGIFDRAPSIILLILLMISIMVGLFLWLMLGSPWAALVAPPLVWIAAHMYLVRRQRNFINRAIEELIPFLNRIVTQVKAGRPAQEAYLQAVAEAGPLKELLSDSAAQIVAGERFDRALIGTLPKIPLRMWAVFVRQLELYVELGGDVSTALESTVGQVNEMLQLQAEARADYAIQAKQQRLIVMILLGGLGGYMLMVPGGIEQMKILLTTPGGIVGLLLGTAVMMFGIWFLNKQLRDVERKLAF